MVWRAGDEGEANCFCSSIEEVKAKLIEVVSWSKLTGVGQNKSENIGGSRVNLAKLVGGVNYFSSEIWLPGSALEGDPSFDNKGVVVSPKRGSGFQATIVQTSSMVLQLCYVVVVVVSMIRRGREVLQLQLVLCGM